MIRLENVTKEYQNIKVLNRINLSFREKEFVCIIGPSGSGKTTLLNLIGGNDTASSGNIYYGGNNLNRIDKDYYHNKIVSYIYQDYNLINNLNIMDNLTLGLKFTNQDINENKIRCILKSLNLNCNLKKDINSLSGGEKQRIAIIRSLISNNEIILADEPTGALDSKNGLKVMDLLKDISKGKLVIMVTHNESLANKYATRIIRIKDGNIVSDSHPYYEEIKLKLNKPKIKLNIKDLFKIAIINLKNKRSRNMLTIIAFSIGLFSLAFVLAISKGFNKDLKTSLYNYPLIISKKSINLNPKVKEQRIKGEININHEGEIVTNKIDDILIKQVSKIDSKLLNGITYQKDLDSKFISVSYVNPGNHFFYLISGKYSLNSNECMLLLDENNGINENVSNYLNLNHYKYQDVLLKKIKVNQKELIITGIFKSNNSYFKSLNGLIYDSNLFDEEITDIYLYAKNYSSKEKIKSLLKRYYIRDDAKSVTDISYSLIKGISLILIIFSFISLVVAVIMISILSYINVLERKKEIGIMKSLGARNKDLNKLFMMENNIIGLTSACFSLITAYISSQILNNIIKRKIAFEHLINLYSWNNSIKNS